MEGSWRTQGTFIGLRQQGDLRPVGAEAQPDCVCRLKPGERDSSWARADYCAKWINHWTSHCAGDFCVPLISLSVRSSPHVRIGSLVQGPALGRAVAVAAQLRASLPADVLLSLLRHADPDIRANACRCACRRPGLIVAMIDLLEDLNPAVARSAACALGQMGRIEARPMLAGLLREEPSEEVIDAVSAVADEECMVLLGRIARSKPALSDATLNALENIDHDRASAIAAAIRGQGSAMT
jgi:hypothetical protein